MVSITVLEIHLDDATFSVDQPFNTITGSKETGDETDSQTDNTQTETEQTDNEETGAGVVDGDPPVPTKTLAVAGAVLVFVGVAAALRRFVGGEDPEVEIDTPDDENRPVGVTVDE